MINEDLQDDDVDLTDIKSADQLKLRCRTELAGLPERVERHFPLDKSPSSGSIRLLQWNVLAQCKSRGNFWILTTT